ncbi:hypothetical protein [Segatella baroniae]|uniref:hypothetical protein n=1 Tax=Segatella baroniae TaxID=305719 RepID=UPI00046FB441|nr:hypothetical protein [Segatella baroniae]
MMAAVGWKRDEERYDSPQMKVANQTLTMSLGVEYKWQRGHFAWETGLNAGMQSGWDNSYNVTATTDAVQEAWLIRLICCVEKAVKRSKADSWACENCRTSSLSGAL